MMHLTTDEREQVIAMRQLCTRLIFHEQTNSIERSFLVELRTKLEAVSLMEVAS